MKAYNSLNIKISIGDSNVVRLYFLQLVYEKNYRHMCADLQYKVDGLKDEKTEEAWLKTSFDEASKIPKSDYDKSTNEEKKKCELLHPAHKDWLGYEWRNPRNKTCRYLASTRKTDEICDRHFPSDTTASLLEPFAGIIRKTRRVRCKRLLNAKRKMIVDGISCKKDVCNNITRKIEAVAKSPSSDKNHYLSSSWLHNAYETVKKPSITTNKQVNKICSSEFPFWTTKNWSSSTKRWQCKDLLNKYVNSVKNNNDCNPPVGGIRYTRNKRILSKCKTKKRKHRKVNIRNHAIGNARKTKKIGGLRLKKGEVSPMYLLCWGIGRIGLFIMLYLFCLVGMGMGVGNLGAVLAGIGLPLGQPVAIPALTATLPISFISWFFFAILLRINYEEVRGILYCFQVLYKWVLGYPRFRKLKNSRSYYSEISSFIKNRVEELNEMKKKMLEETEPIKNDRLITLVHIFYIFKIYDWDNGKCIQYVDKINKPFLIGKIKGEKNFNDLIEKIENNRLKNNDLEIFIKQEINPLLLKCLDLTVFIWKMENPVISGERLDFAASRIVATELSIKYDHNFFLNKIDQILSLLPLDDLYVLSRVKYILSFKIFAITTWANDFGTRVAVLEIMRNQSHSFRSVAFSPKSFQVGLLSIATELKNFSIVKKLIYTQSFLSLDEIQYFRNKVNGHIVLNGLISEIQKSDSLNKLTLLSSICVFTIANTNPFKMTETIYFSIPYLIRRSIFSRNPNSVSNDRLKGVLSNVATFL